MLIQFSFKNYKSFRDEAILDLSATKITEFGERVVEIGNEKLLPTAAIFGANASGKSNVIEAFRFMVSYVLESFAYGGEGSKAKRVKCPPFMFDRESKDEGSTFEVYFISSEEDGCKTYNYGFTIDQSGVAEEWLNTKSKTARKFKRVIYRSKEELDLSGLPAKSQENIRIALEKEALVISLGAKLKIAKLKAIRDWFSTVSFADFGNPVENYFLSSRIPEGFAEDRAVQKKVANYFASFDPSIIDFNVEVIDEDDEAKRVRIDAIHQVVGSDETVSIPLEEESAGTLKMFALYPVLQEALENGGVLLVDELNARLHPLLVRTFVIAFLNPEINKKHAQLVFTTHEAWQMGNNMLRRDEIWFTEKDTDGVSTLYSLADFVDADGVKIRKDESYEKNYLLGKYGAIPTLRSFDMFTEA